MRAAELGDRRWRELLKTLSLVVREQLERYRGHEVDSAGDGFFATFDGPGRVVRCAWAIQNELGRLRMHIRAGLHTGECELVGDKVRGIAVHTASRIASLAAADEVLVSSTVQDLVAGSGIAFEDRGAHELKGLPGDWRIFKAAMCEPPEGRDFTA